MGSFWPPARLERLRKLAETTDMTASQIGDALGVSRNAVIGKVHREGIYLAGSPFKYRPHPTR